MMVSNYKLSGVMTLQNQKPAGNEPEVIGTKISAESKVGVLYKFDRADFSNRSIYSSVGARDTGMNKMFEEWRIQRSKNPSLESDHIVDNTNGKLKLVKGSVFDEKPIAGDLSFLVNAAKEYAKIRPDQEFKTSPIEGGEFSSAVYEHIYGSFQKDEGDIGIGEQIDKVVKELAQQIRETGTTDFSKLETGFEFGGDKVSVTDLSKMLSGAEAISKRAKSTGTVMHGGSLPMVSYAEQGAVKALSTTYFSSFSNKIADRIGDKINKQVDKAFADSQKMSEQYMKENPNDYSVSSVKAYYEEAFEKFSNMDTSSGQALKSDFEEMKQWFSSTALGGHDSTVKILTERINQLFNQCFG